MALRTDYKNDELNTAINTERQFEEVTNPNGTKSYRDVTDYSQVGDSFDADLVNAQNAEINAKAPLDSPAFTGTPTAPTQPQSTADDTIATTSFVKSTFNNFVDPSLRVYGKAADAQVTGNRIAAVEASIPNVDTELEIQGAAADAQATGIAIANVSSHIDSFASENNIAFLANNYGNYINLSDEITANSILRCSDYIEVPQNANSVTFRQMIESGGSLVSVYPAMVSYKEDKTVYAYHSTSGTDEYRTMGIDPSIIRYVRINQANINRSDTERSMLKFNTFSSADVFNVIKSGMQYVTQGGAIPANSDLFTLKPNKVYHLTSNSATMSNLPYTGFLGMVIPFNAVYTTYPAITTFIIAISSTNRFFIAHSWGTTTFSSWVELSATDDTIFKYRTHLTTGGDVNNFTEMGVYLVDGSLNASNKPFGTTSCHVAVFVDSYGNLSQLAISLDGRIAYRRRNRAGVFTSEWQSPVNNSETLYQYRDALTSGTDLDTFTETGTYVIPTSVTGVNDPFEGIGGHLAVFTDPNGCICQLAIRQDGKIASRRKESASASFSEWTFALNSAHVGDYVGSFTATKQLKDTGIQLKAGVTYIVVNNPVATDKPYTGYSGFYNIFIASNPSAYSKHIGKYQTIQRFTPTLDGALGIYNPVGDGGYGYGGDVSISVYKEADFLPHQKKIVTVGKDANSYDFTSFTAALLALKDNADEKEIHIYPGEYDLFQEYNDAGVPVYEGDSPTYDYFDYCVWIPSNTHIIGHGIVRLNWMPEGSQITANQSTTVSPINTAGSMTLENVEIHTKKSRYCIHDDPLGKREYIMAVKKYINVRCYKYPNDTGKGWTHIFGGGFDMGDRYEFHNCVFVNTCYGRTLYGHARGTSENIVLTEVASPNIVVENCVMQTNGTQCVVFGNAATSAPLHIRVDMNNCYISGNIHVKDEGGDTGNRRNAFDLKVLGGNITASKVLVLDQSNPYPPQIYSFT